MTLCGLFADDWKHSSRCCDLCKVRHARADVLIADKLLCALSGITPVVANPVGIDFLCVIKRNPVFSVVVKLADCLRHGVGLLSMGWD